MKIRDADGVVFDLPQHVATGLARSLSNSFELVTDEPATTAETKTKADAPASPPVDAKPSSTWTNAQLATWAEDNKVDLGGATKKQDMLTAIAAASTPPPPPSEDAQSDDQDDAKDDELDQPVPDTADLASDEDDSLEPYDPEPEDDESDGTD